MIRRALLLVALAACSPPGSEPRWQAAGAATPRRGGSLRISIKDPVATLDPVYAYDEGSYFGMRWLFEPLLDYAPGTTELIPRLAERWEVSADATTYRFALRDARYSDGTPVVSGDIKFALERARTTPDSPFGAFLGDVVTIEAPDERELVIQLSRPNAGFIYVLAMPFTSPQRAGHVAAAGDQLRRSPLGNGPYVLAEWRDGERLVFRRNENYRGTQPAYLDEYVVFESMPRDTQFLMFEQGALDSAYRLAAPDELWVRSQPAWAPYIQSTALLDVIGARFDVTQKPFDDARVRRAFNLALDRSHITKLLAGKAVPAHGMLPPGVPGHDATLPPIPHDPARARSLLAEAGYPNGVTVDFVTIADEEAERLAASYQADFAEAGITVRLQVVSFSVYLSMIGKRGGAPFTFAGWQADAPDPTNFFDAKLHSRAISDEASANDTFYANPALDAVLDAARADLDPRRRAARYREAERILADDPPWLWGYHQTSTEISQPYVKGIIPHPVWIRDFSSVWLDLGADGERDERRELR